MCLTVVLDKMVRAVIVAYNIYGILLILEVVPRHMPRAHGIIILFFSILESLLMVINWLCYDSRNLEIIILQWILLCELTMRLYIYPTTRAKMHQAYIALFNRIANNGTVIKDQFKAE